ncbi:helix-turn-helix domain-containing protein [Cellulomonas sp. PS-H5]|uniref:helix-turn-helix domain-containing protein n=1 Tax=Cellulomonas sp. PS-H5 TaxID=2820400 RepID=UPI001C501E47|nr:helix-turn-helix domain-containing protein [Cellulomonas sp. PS-H5]MBW0252460.1 helix-turn-helix domain-containing protein [Cellulomonas sp. PS-H5]
MEVSVREAADALGVSDRRVRQLVASGRIRARRVGSQWLVDGASLPIAPRRSRPLSPTEAWLLLATDQAPGARPGRWRDRRDRLRTDPSPETLLASWAAARGDRLLFATREPRGVLDDPAVVRSGLSDPRAGISAADLAEGYVRRDDLDSVRRRHLLRPATGRPDVVLHVVAVLPTDPVPPLVLAADLAEHDGPRELARASELIAQAVRAA